MHLQCYFWFVNQNRHPQRARAAKKVQKPAKIVQEKPIIIKAPTKKVKKIIIQEEEEPEYEIEYRKAPAKQVIPEKKEKEIVNNLKDIPMDNPLLGLRVYRNK